MRPVRLHPRKSRRVAPLAEPEEVSDVGEDMDSDPAEDTAAVMSSEAVLPRDSDSLDYDTPAEDEWRPPQAVVVPAATSRVTRSSCKRDRAPSATDEDVIRGVRGEQKLARVEAAPPAPEAPRAHVEQLPGTRRQQAVPMETSGGSGAAADPQPQPALLRSMRQRLLRGKKDVAEVCQEGSASRPSSWWAAIRACM